MRVKFRGPGQEPPEKFDLTGDKLALETRLQGLVAEKMKTGSDTVKAVLSQFDLTRVTSVSEDGFTLRIYSGIHPFQEDPGVAKATMGKAIIRTRVAGRPPEETVNTLQNKIQFIGALKETKVIEELQIELEKLVKEKGGVVSDSSKKILDSIGDMRINQPLGKDIHINIYGQNEVFVAAALSENNIAGRDIHMHRCRGKHSPETEQSLRNKIEFVEILE